MKIIIEKGTFEEKLRVRKRTMQILRETGAKTAKTKFLQYSSNSKETFMVRADLVMAR